MPAARSLIRIVVNVVIDGALASLAVPVAWWIADPATALPNPLLSVPLGAATLLLAGLPFRLSRQYWRFAGLGDLLTVTASAALGAALFALTLYARGAGPISPGFPLAHGLTLLAFLGAPRVAYRWFRSRDRSPVAEADATAVVVVGQSEDCDLFLRSLARDRRQRFRVEGLITPGDRHAGRRIQGYPILGALRDAGAVLERLRDEDRLPGTLVMATPDLPGPALAGLVAQADRFGLRVRRAPRLTELDKGLTGNHALGEPKPLELRPIEIEDLLNRPQAPLDRDGMARLIQGRRVIVTGAGGTIGSELARQVAALRPRNASSCSTTANTRCGRSTWNWRRTHPGRSSAAPSLIADIRDEARIRGIFEVLRPELVFHAAALKHVPMVEDEPPRRPAHQRRRHPPRRRCRPRHRRACDGADLDRQGGEPHQRDGRVEAHGRDVLPGARHPRPSGWGPRRGRPGRERPGDALRHRALRQRARQHRIGRAACSSASWSAVAR